MLTLLVGLGFVAGTAGLALASYAAMRWLAADRAASDTKDLAGSVVFRMSALHGLILALVFAQELLGYQRLRSALVDEATAVADIYNDIRRHGGPAEVPVQRALSDYVRTVVVAEWPALAREGRLTAEGWQLREAVYLAVLDLPATGPREEALRRHMLADIHDIAAVRQLRENMADRPINPLFWFAAVSGVVLISLPYFVFRPTPVNLALLGLYGGFTGVVMFIIYALSDPFSPPGMLEPSAMQRLLRSEIGAGPSPG